ncbi:MAG: 50S ribosomal protein L25 [Bdellovibrionales bacterium]|nr:50S ribosomal protein L25 [Bdellovibrionales bacterium]
MSSFIKITTFSRESGRQNSKAIRIGKKVPAVVYGPKTENQIFCISIQDSIKYSASKYNNEIFQLESEDKKLNDLKVLCKSTNIHPVKREPVHMDFYALNMKENIVVDLDLNFEGIDELQKNNLEANIAQKNISIECSPTSIPESAVINLADLKAGDSFTVEQLAKQLNLTDVKILTELSTTLASVSEKKEEVEEVVEAVSPADTPASADAKTSGDKPDDAKSADAKSSGDKSADAKSSGDKSADAKKDGSTEGKKS